MKALFVLWLAMWSCGSCTPATSPTFDAGDASQCAVDQAITNGRMIRTPSGAPLVVTCGDAGQ